MAERLNYAKGFPEGVHAIFGVEKAIRGIGLESSRRSFVAFRVEPGTSEPKAQGTA
jgi:hypothetical protein